MTCETRNLTYSSIVRLRMTANTFFIDPGRRLRLQVPAMEDRACDVAPALFVDDPAFGGWGGQTFFQLATGLEHDYRSCQTSERAQDVDALHHRIPYLVIHDSTRRSSFLLPHQGGH